MSGGGLGSIMSPDETMFLDSEAMSQLELELNSIAAGECRGPNSMRSLGVRTPLGIGMCMGGFGVIQLSPASNSGGLQTHSGGVGLHVGMKQRAALNELSLANKTDHPRCSPPGDQDGRAESKHQAAYSQANMVKLSLESPLAVKQHIGWNVYDPLTVHHHPGQATATPKGANAVSAMSSGSEMMLSSRPGSTINAASLHFDFNELITDNPCFHMI